MTKRIFFTDINTEQKPWKGYIWLTDVVASTHALHSLHHVCVWPVSPAGVVVSLVTHGYLNARQHTAGQHRSHAGESETGAGEDSCLRSETYRCKPDRRD